MLHQQEEAPQQWKYVEDDAEKATIITLRSCKPSLEFTPLDFVIRPFGDNIFHITFSSLSHPLPPYPSIPFDTPQPSPSKLPSLHVASGQKTGYIKTAKAKATVNWSYSPTVSISYGDGPPIYEDLPYRSYAVDGRGTAHYLKYDDGVLHLGLGEKAAPMDLSGRKFLIGASDTFGYDSWKTDPLYKHIPFLVTASPTGCIGIFSTSHARATWSVGSEIDGPWGPYKVYRQAYGGLDEYVIVGKTLEEVVCSYAQLAGFPLRVPRYMMGYIGGGMKYSMLDTPRAADAILNFIDKCDELAIPISAFQMSSGYTVAEREPKTRNVFTWNRHRFPDPKAFVDGCHKRGVRLLANIKPYVLATHPEFGPLAGKGAFFKDPNTKSFAVARLWSAAGGESDEGAYIDFSSHAGSKFWLEGCRDLRKLGIDGIWNDNNEFTIPNDAWLCSLQTVPWTGPLPPLYPAGHIGLWGRAMQTEFMAKTSYQACLDIAPDDRPLVLTRSATAGTLRYASCSWGGDNVTSWAGMIGGNALALNAGISLIQCYGNDVGGFEGPLPEKELFVRWVRMAIYSARFAINCFKTSADDKLVGDVLEPWTYPDVTHMIAYAIKRRYELIPYIYSLSLESHLTGMPPQRWTGWGFESDPLVWSKEVLALNEAQFWFGDALFIWCVREPNTSYFRVYLPKGMLTAWGFLNITTNHHYTSGSWHVMPTNWEAKEELFGSALARCGSAFPIGKRRPTAQYPKHDLPGLDNDDMRGVEIFPPPIDVLEGTTSFENMWHEDDGISKDAGLCHVTFTYTADLDGCIEVDVRLHLVDCRGWKPPWLRSGLAIVMPVGDKRKVWSRELKVVGQGTERQWGRETWLLDVPMMVVHID